MIGSLYTGISGLRANADAMTVIGDNIANVSTTAFKTSTVSFANVLNQSLNGFTGNEIGAGVQLQGVSANWEQGSLRTTSNPTDMAINGEGFFMVNDPTGTTFFTRAGEFTFDTAAFLTNPNGLIVQGYAFTDATDPTTVDTTALVDIQVADLDKYRNVEVNAEGIMTGVWADVDAGTHVRGQREYLYQVALADFSNIWGLAKMGGNLYSETADSGTRSEGPPNTLSFGNISSSSLEMSNVDLAQAFVEMITTQRAFQANSRVVTTSDEILQELINLKR
jgi:flagellar hook protein FlgE